MIGVTWFGTASVLIEVGGEKILFDPFFRMNKKLEKTDMDVFVNVDYIFNTHPHFDHLRDLPAILAKTDAKFYGTPTAYLRLETQGVDVDKKVEILCPHEEVKTAKTEILTHRTFHVRNDVGIILKTAARILFLWEFGRAFRILKEHNNFRMGGDILAYEIRAEDKTILLFGSAGFDERAKLPKEVDILIWPYQGRLNMLKYSLPIIEAINPKTVVLDHFDDAFPPITGKVDVEKFVGVMRQKHPEIRVIVPKYGEKLKF